MHIMHRIMNPNPFNKFLTKNVPIMKRVRNQSILQ